ncbi:cation channel sperm-associated auxiliary subunit zeta isoform X1 [Notamacropus eugenii]|uniref:cation channel sperm-associated auxiliary subunit zeta isoform X1 n=1 Tax=Notamacropus eugenii TaxID=9315 RepID=UPI003B67474A
MENQDSNLPAKVESQDQSKRQTPVQVDDLDLQDSLLGFCSLGNSIAESEDSQRSLEKSPRIVKEVRKLWIKAGATQRSREGESSIDSKTALDNWGTQSIAMEEDEVYFSRASVSAPLQDFTSSTQPSPMPRRNRESVDRNKNPESSDEVYNGLRDATHRAYWAELQNRLPLPLANLMEQEALEILTKSLRSYNKGIGKDHKLTQQLQRHVDQLRKNLQGRQFT